MTFGGSNGVLTAVLCGFVVLWQCHECGCGGESVPKGAGARDQRAHHLAGGVKGSIEKEMCIPILGLSLPGMPFSKVGWSMTWFVFHMAQSFFF